MFAVARRRSVRRRTLRYARCAGAAGQLARRTGVPSSLSYAALALNGISPRSIFYRKNYYHRSRRATRPQFGDDPLAAAYIEIEDGRVKRIGIRLP